MKVLVTGSGGFIGGRIVELLSDSGIEVRAGVRRWSSGARIGRRPVEIVACDILDAAQMDDACRDVDAIVHCAVGDHRATVDGTRGVLEAAVRNDIGRVVHISTVDVYGSAEGEFDEKSPHMITGRAYGDSKIEAERVCAEFSERGLPIVILRPTIVYGPFSESWTVEFAQRLRTGNWLLPAEDCQGACNLVYVDDVVAAVELALRSDAAVGGAFNVNGPDRVTWQDYFQALNDALLLPPLRPASRSRARLSTAVMTPVRNGAKFLLKHFSPVVMGMYQKYAPVRAVMKMAEAAIRQTPTGGEFVMYSRNVRFPAEHAREVLGYAPAFDLHSGVEMSAAWLHHTGIVALPEGAASGSRAA
jgi:nucleoside-diphosphate-sugar epimerase